LTSWDTVSSRPHRQSTKMASVFRTLRGLVREYPVVKNCATYGTLFCTAELTQQIFIKKYTTAKQGKPSENLDSDKLQRFAILGYTVIPSIMTVWYRWLDTKYTSTATKVVFKKVVLDQICLSIPLLFVFYVSMSWFEGQHDLLSEFKQKFPESFALNNAFWLPAQAINFKLVPAQYRIAYNGCCGFIWANILCILKRRGEQTDKVKITTD